MSLRLPLLLSILVISSRSLAMPPTDSCRRVEGFHVHNVSSSSATLVWDAVPLSKGYLYLINDAQTPPGNYGTFIKDATHTETGLAANKTYYAHVLTSCNGTSFSPWATIQFNTPAPEKVRVAEDNIFAISVYPSLAERSVTVKVKGSKEPTASVSLVNIFGQVIKRYRMSGDRLHIEVKTLPANIYLIRYNDNLGRLQNLRFTKV